MSFSKWILLAAVAPWLSTSALAAAGDPGVNTTVEPVPKFLTLSRPAGTGKGAVALETFAAYKFTISNGGSSALNRVFLNGTATTDVGTPVVFDSSIPASACTGVVGAPNQVSCSLGSLAPGAISVPIVVVFKAPTTGAEIRFVSTSGGFEGNGGSNGCCSQPNTATTTLEDPTTSITFTTEAKTFVRPTAVSTVFTGNSAIVTSADGWSTLVTIPPGFGTTSLGDYTVAAIKETSSADTVQPVPALACPGYALQSTCFASDLSIPGKFVDPLLITLRLHKDYFKLGNLKPADVKLYYTPTGAAAINILVPLELCSVAVPAATGIPCLAAPPALIKSSSAIPKDLWGALEFKVQAVDNGKYSQ